MTNDYIYCCENAYGKTFTHYDRELTFEWYERNNGIKIWTKTKDLRPTIQVIVDRPHVDINNIREDDIINKTSVALRKAVAKFDAKNTKQIKLKLNCRTDEMILEKLEQVDNIQGYIKQLILQDIEKKQS